MQGELLTFLSYTKLMLAGNAYDAIYYKSSVNILTNQFFFSYSTRKSSVTVITGRSSYTFLYVYSYLYKCFLNRMVPLL